ncbi:MAG: hypothetical protein JWL71_168 [Acidobacteria bacterium]|nr:hypothetical protein [Acidobacteriota bacterium]
MKAAAAGLAWPAWPTPDAAGETLYNGIRLPRPWPPDRRSLPLRPLPPPYLVAPPDVIPIDVGRQMFVDDFLIQETTLERAFHRPEYYSDNPILWPNTRWEKYDEYAERTKTRSNPAAMVFSDGVFFDPHDRLFKMWYMGGYSQNVCYAYSHDGMRWEKPSLDIVAGTNITMGGHRDSSTVWLDQTERDPARRFKMAYWYDHYLVLLDSPDGIHWHERGRSGPAGDRTTFFHNPFRARWVFSIRDDVPGAQGRHRRYVEGEDFVEASRWRANQPVMWVGADADDPRRPEYNVPTELYNLDCVGYESLMLGLFTIFRGERLDREKPNDVCVGYSRDGFHWDRPDRRAFLPVSEHMGDWNWANVQSAGGCCLIVGDRLHFYVSGRRGVPGTTEPGFCSTGLATLRRDGFASMTDRSDARGIRRDDTARLRGTLVTRPVTFSGSHVFVNADIRGGLAVEMLDREGRVIAPYGAAQCEPVRGDGTKMAVTWRGVPSVAALAGRPVRFRFTLTDGDLFAFWVSPQPSGISRGFVAAGGPGFTGPRDGQ